MKAVGKRSFIINKFRLAIALVISTLFMFGFTSIDAMEPVTSDNIPTNTLVLSVEPDRFEFPELFKITRERIESNRRKQNALNEFVESLENGNAWQIVGIYVEDKFDLSVVLQPSSNPGFISGLEGTATQFSMASDYGTIGMLAHNYLAGEYYSELISGDNVYVIYGDGSVDQFIVREIKQYQALSPYSAYSNFVDLDTDDFLNVEQLFYSIYQGDGELVFQTCIDNEGIDTWGRYFVIAEPVS
jgi:hypothetical protein